MSSGRTFQAWWEQPPTALTGGARGVDGLVCLDEEVPTLEANQHRFLHHRCPEVCHHSHVLVPLLRVELLTSRDLCTGQQEVSRESVAGRGAQRASPRAPGPPLSSPLRQEGLKEEGIRRGGISEGRGLRGEGHRGEGLRERESKERGPEGRSARGEGPEGRSLEEDIGGPGRDREGLWPTVVPHFPAHLDGDPAEMSTGCCQHCLLTGQHLLL